MGFISLAREVLGLFNGTLRDGVLALEITDFGDNLFLFVDEHCLGVLLSVQLALKTVDKLQDVS